MAEDSRKLFVAGLPDSITEDVLRQLFEATGGTVVEVSIDRGPTCWRIAVCDAGPGIPASEAERVFEPFYRLVPTTTPGAGLGLAIVREVARRHRGRAFVDLDYAAGARIAIELPM